MCLYPRLIINPKYKPNKKNGGVVPECKDKRTMWVPVGCTRCMECLKQRARGWKIRLMEEIKEHERGKKHFITLTLSNESIRELSEHEDVIGKTGYERDNAIATVANRRFMERWRAKNGKSLRHWLVTELGHNGTENIHLHGILFTESVEEIAQVWKYGYVWAGSYVNEATINYVIKYCTKQDLVHTQYKPKILASPGIGAQYTHTHNAQQHKYKPGGNTQELYRTREGFKMSLPAYYRNKLYSEEQKEQLWIEKIDKKERWVDGSRVSIAHGDTEYYKVLKNARKKNQRLGYGTDEKNWDREQYEYARRELNHKQRTEANETNGTDIMDIRETPQMARRGDNETARPSKRLTEWIRENVTRLTT